MTLWDSLSCRTMPSGFFYFFCRSVFGILLSGSSVLFSTSDSGSILFLTQDSRSRFFQLFDPKVLALQL
ncbi:hypothetical protein RhiirA5_434056 [Rhizophagus irregularis]|uniref:Uncharacterized protein n=1 Tax=Rhizophagus irregularis TaxID=588596 RepID=A0A2I1FNW7_9GLOM|nr:hypothetical protein RhiirA5_434056 [Rhizophagus irregularis]PKY36051.1 hypothetical protein RhiirB3_457885 [Rhizophagus irregularis]